MQDCKNEDPQEIIEAADFHYQCAFQKYHRVLNMYKNENNLKKEGELARRIGTLSFCFAEDKYPYLVRAARCFSTIDVVASISCYESAEKILEGLKLWHLKSILAFEFCRLLLDNHKIEQVLTVLTRNINSLFTHGRFILLFFAHKMVLYQFDIAIDRGLYVIADQHLKEAIKLVQSLPFEDLETSSKNVLCSKSHMMREYLFRVGLCFLVKIFMEDEQYRLKRPVDILNSIAEFQTKLQILESTVVVEATNSTFNTSVECIFLREVFHLFISGKKFQNLEQKYIQLTTTFWSPFYPLLVLDETCSNILSSLENSSSQF